MYFSKVCIYFPVTILHKKAVFAFQLIHIEANHKPGSALFEKLLFHHNYHCELK